MAKYAFLSYDIKCLKCNALIINEIPFQWGYCVGSLPRSETLYSIGDLIRWHKAPNGSIFPWTYFWREGHEFGGNLGDDTIVNLVLCASWPTGVPGLTCHQCSSAWGGVAIDIRDGSIHHAWLYRSEEFEEDAEIYLHNADGSFRPMIEWGNRPMSRLDEDLYKQ
jgi:hypothetical protein